jgi:hypothetical protein
MVKLHRGKKLKNGVWMGFIPNYLGLGWVFFVSFQIFFRLKLRGPLEW